MFTRWDIECCPSPNKLLKPLKIITACSVNDVVVVGMTPACFGTCNTLAIIAKARSIGASSSSTAAAAGCVFSNAANKIFRTVCPRKSPSLNRYSNAAKNSFPRRSPLIGLNAINDFVRSPTADTPYWSRNLPVDPPSSDICTNACKVAISSFINKGSNASNKREVPLPPPKITILAFSILLIAVQLI